MTKILNRPARLCLVLVLMIALIPNAVRADDGKDRPIRLYTTAALGPIGSVYSLVGVTINGRLADGEQAIWDGDVVEVTARSSARVLVDSVGEVLLKSGARARLATTLTRLDDHITRRVLIASLISGDMVVKLEQDAGAYIESGRLAFTTSSGAHFCVRVWEGRAFIDKLRGAVWIQDLEPPTIKAKSVQVQPGSPPVELPSDTPLEAKPNEIKRVSAWWKRHRKVRRAISLVSTAAPLQAPSQDIEEPVAFRRVTFTVEAATGTIDSEGITDANGVVTVNFRAAPKARNGKIVGIIDPNPIEDGPDARYENFERNVKITPGFVSKWGKYIIPPIVGGIVIEEILRRRKEPLQQVPPPIIR